MLPESIPLPGVWPLLGGVLEGLGVGQEIRGLQVEYSPVLSDYLDKKFERSKRRLLRQ